MYAPRHLGYGGLRRQKTAKIHGKKLVVAVDGSKMSQRAVLLAAWLHDEGAHDKIKIISVSDAKTSKMEALGHVKEAEKALSTHGVRPFFIEPGTVLPCEGNSLVDTLCGAASGGNLSLGADGRKVSPLESVSLGVMGKCRAPVLLAKPKATPALGTTKGTQLRRDGQLGITIVVAVDGSHIAQKCFDMAMRFVKKGDTVTCFHVKNADREVLHAAEANSLIGSSAVETYYKGECAKAGSRVAAGFSFQARPMSRSGSISQTIIDFAEEALADMVILGSVELGKPGADVSTLGSVAAAVAKKTSAHVLVAKHFA